MEFIGSAKKREFKAVCIDKYVDTQTGEVEYTFWPDKYEEDVYLGRKTVEEIVVQDFYPQDHI